MFKLAQLVTSLSLLTLAACGSSATEAPVPDAPPSGDAPASDGYDPCAGKKEGDSCTICPPAKADCMETMQLKVCNAEGQCTSQMGEVQ